MRHGETVDLLEAFVQGHFLDMATAIEAVTVDIFHSEGHLGAYHLGVVEHRMVGKHGHGAQVTLVGHLGRDAGIDESVCCAGQCGIEVGVGRLVVEAVHCEGGAGGKR